MNKNISIAISITVAIVIGIVIGRSMDSPSGMPGHSDREAKREVLYWVAPMDPNYRRDEAGKSPMGMDLVPVYAGEVDSRSGVVKIDPTVVNNLGVRTDLAQRGSLPRLIDTVGYVSYDENTVIWR